MDDMRFAMLLKKRGVRINQEVSGISISEILDCLSEETQNKLAAGNLNYKAIEELFADSMKSCGIKKIDNEILKRLEDTSYLENLKNRYN